MCVTHNKQPHTQLLASAAGSCCCSICWTARQLDLPPAIHQTINPTPPTLTMNTPRYLYSVNRKLLAPSEMASWMSAAFCTTCRHQTHDSRKFSAPVPHHHHLSPSPGTLCSARLTSSSPLCSSSKRYSRPLELRKTFWPAMSQLSAYLQLSLDNVILDGGCSCSRPFVPGAPTTAKVKHVLCPSCPTHLARERWQIPASRATARRQWPAERTLGSRCWEPDPESCWGPPPLPPPCFSVAGD